MCGIAGIVKVDPRERVEEERLHRMRDALRHRGPDGEGMIIDGPVGLAHVRLAIVDLEGGRQPMSNEDGTVWVVLNGEIYNHADLRPLLRARGHSFRTRSDTESIVHLYEDEGERCVERLRGMFAFALWAPARRQLLLARDRLGIKPLYFAMTGSEILFASEIKAILAAGPIRPHLNRDIIPEYLATRFVSGEETFFRGVRKLLPGRTLTWSWRHGCRQRRYWQPAQRTESLPATLHDRAHGLRERLTDAVRSHLMGDVPVGLFLSGGIDSSGLAGLMAAQVDHPISTFSVGFADPGANELAYARLMARSIGAEHREVTVSSDEFFAELPRLIWHEDEPIAFPSSVPLYFLSCLARRHVKVVLTGEGADELFLGYNRYRVTLWNERLERACGSLLGGGARGGMARLAGKLPGRLRRYALRTALVLPPGPRSLFYENFAVFPVPLQRRLLTDAALIARRDPYHRGLSCYREGAGDTRERMARADLQTYLVELLMKQDQMSMAASLESRVPFLDHPLVEYSTAIPGHFHLRLWRTKAVLRAAVRDLVPLEVRKRKKAGFPVPLGRWLRDGHRSVADEFILSERARARGLFEPAEAQRLVAEHGGGGVNHADRLWLLINLEIWQRIFLDGEDRSAIGRSRHA